MKMGQTNMHNFKGILLRTKDNDFWFCPVGNLIGNISGRF
jgi:hypothetical protein